MFLFMLLTEYLKAVLAIPYTVYQVIGHVGIIGPFLCFCFSMRNMSPLQIAKWKNHMSQVYLMLTRLGV